MILLSPDEKIVLVVHKHWFVFLSHGLIIALFVILPFLAYPFLNNFLLFIFFSSLWLLLCWCAFFVVWTNNYLDMLIVTNRRLIDIDQISLFHRQSSSFPLDKIQNITVEINGMLATSLHFGNIHIETAGETRSLRINTIADPENIRKIISETIATHHLVVSKLDPPRDQSI